jgi:hypothetical protein
MFPDIACEKLQARNQSGAFVPHLGAAGQSISYSNFSQRHIFCSSIPHSERIKESLQNRRIASGD